MKKFRLSLTFLLAFLLAAVNIYAAGFYFKGEAEYIQDAKIKNIDMEQWRALSYLGYKFNGYFAAAAVVGTQDLTINDFLFRYNNFTYQNPSYKMKLTYGAEIQGGKILSTGPLSFGYNGRIIKTDFDNISGMDITQLKQTLVTFDIISKYSISENAYPYISAGYIKNKLSAGMLSESNNENDKNLRVKLGFNIKAADNISFDLSGSIIGERGAKLGIKYISGVSEKKAAKKSGDKSGKKKKNSAVIKETEKTYWVCKNGHKFDKEMKFCIDCGGSLEKIEPQKINISADASNSAEFESLENVSDKPYWVCKNGHKFDKEMKFCIDCGEVLEKVEPVIQRHVVTKYINVCPVCGKEYDEDAKFCTDDGAKLAKKRVLSKPQFKFIDAYGNVYLNENEVPHNVKAIKYNYDEKILVGYQSLGTGKIYKEKLNFCPETGKPIVPLYR